MKGKIDLHGHEPSIDISSFSTELFKESCFDVTILSSSSSSERGSMWMGEGKSKIEELGELGGEGVAGDASRSKYCI